MDSRARTSDRLVGRRFRAFVSHPPEICLERGNYSRKPPANVTPQVAESKKYRTVCKKSPSYTEKSRSGRSQTKSAHNESRSARNKSRSGMQQFRSGSRKSPSEGNKSRSERQKSQSGSPKHRTFYYPQTAKGLCLLTFSQCLPAFSEFPGRARRCANVTGGFVSAARPLGRA